MDRGAWWTIVRVAKSWTRLSTGVCVCTHTHILHTNTVGSSSPSTKQICSYGQCSVQLLSSVQLFASLWTVAWPGFPVHHQFLELAQTHVPPVSDAIQPSNPLQFPSPPAFNLSQNQGVFQGVSSSHQVAKVLELQHQSSQRLFRTDFLYDGLVGFLCSPRDSHESSSTPQFKSIDSLVLSFLYSSTLTSIPQL